MTTENYAKPLPRIDELTRPFWDAAREGRLAIQRCRECGYYNHPPKPLCDACSSEDLGFESVSGRGKVYSYTVMHQRNVAGFEPEVPYVNLIVELDEQPLLFLISYLPGSDADRVAIGRPVEVTFEPAGEGIVLPQFRLIE
jgi:uncharacterized OB-fold protein